MLPLVFPGGTCAAPRKEDEDREDLANSMTEGDGNNDDRSYSTYYSQLRNEDRFYQALDHTRALFSSEYRRKNLSSSDGPCYGREQGRGNGIRRVSSYRVLL